MEFGGYASGYAPPGAQDLRVVPWALNCFSSPIREPAFLVVDLMTKWSGVN